MNTQNAPRPDSKRIEEMVAAHANVREVKLTDTEQALLASAYGFGLNARKSLTGEGLPPRVRRQLRGYITTGDIAGELLMRSLRGLVVAITQEYAQHRLGSNWAKQEMDDLLGEGVLVTLECCADFDESRGTTVAQWVAIMVRQRLKGMDFAAGGGKVPKEWKRVATAMHAVEQTASTGIRDQKLYSASDVLEHLMTTETSRQISKGCDTAEAISKAHDTLSRQSVLRAMKEFSEISALSSGVSSMDKVLDGDDTTMLDLVDGGASTEPGVLHSTDAAVLLALLDVLPGQAVIDTTNRHGHAGEEVPYRALADERGGDWLAVRHEVERVKAAPGAPHAQFCAFYPHVSALVEMLPGSVTQDEGEIDVESLRKLLCRAG
jgi:hypothetical protein